MVLPSIFIILQLINAFSSLMCKGFISMIKVSKITTEIRKNNSSLLFNYSSFKHSVLALYIPQNVETEPLRNKATTYKWTYSQLTKRNGKNTPPPPQESICMKIRFLDNRQFPHVLPTEEVSLFSFMPLPTSLITTKCCTYQKKKLLKSV
jgi:hypothetical protein